MSKTQTILTSEYQAICQKLGDLYLKQKQINDAIAQLEAEAESLNKASTCMSRLEAQLNNQLGNRSEKDKPSN